MSKIRKRKRILGIGSRPTGVAKAVRRELLRSGGFTGLEKKFQTASAIELGATALATTWTTKENATMKCISGCAQGDTESTRDGRVYHITSIFVNGQVVIEAAEAATAPHEDIQYVIKMVLDTQTNGAQMTATDVMDGSGIVDTLAFRNLQFTSRFKILGTVKGTVQPLNMNEGQVNSFANGTRIKPFSFAWIPSTPIKVICSGTGSTIADITDNSVHIIACATSTNIDIKFQVRLRWVG